MKALHSTKTSPLLAYFTASMVAWLMIVSVQTAVSAPEAGNQPVVVSDWERRIDVLLDHMSVQEKIEQLPPAMIFAHDGDWHEALMAYRRWLQTWHRTAAPPKPWFREVFNFRQHFLHFFNGEGIWLEGPLSLPQWFPPKVRRLIARCHGILRHHADAFCSMDPVPLVPTVQPDIYANRFPTDRKIVWTLFNASAARVQGEVIRIAHVANAEYYDAWNQKVLRPRIDGSWAFIELAIGARDVGCFVQRF